MPANFPKSRWKPFGERLGQGLAFAEHIGPTTDLTPEDKAAARETAVTCTQTMLMSLDRTERLTYLLDTVFGLTSEQAAAVLEIDPAAFRKRLSRVRAKLEGFQTKTCGLVAPAAACRCEKQLPAKRFLAKTDPDPGTLTLTPTERRQAEQALTGLCPWQKQPPFFAPIPRMKSPACYRQRSARYSSARIIGESATKRGSGPTA